MDYYDIVLVFLAKLSHWKLMRAEELLDILSKLSSAVDEIPQFFVDTLNTLFTILESIAIDQVSRAMYDTITALPLLISSWP